MQDKVCIVTGGSSGIGKSLAIELDSQGAKQVVIADINDGTEVVKSLKNGMYVRCDCSDEQDILKCIKYVEEMFGSVDVFVSNAGIGAGGDLDAFDNARFRKIFDVNVMQHIWAAKYLFPKWLQRPEGGGFLITASAAGLLTQIGSLEYAVTKHAAVSVAEYLAITYGKQNIQVTVLCPQAVDTPMVSGPGAVAAIDGIMDPAFVAKETLSAMKEGKFLVALPSSKVLNYIQRKAGNYDRWIHGMQRLNDHFRDKSKI